MSYIICVVFILLGSGSYCTQKFRTAHLCLWEPRERRAEF